MKLILTILALFAVLTASDNKGLIKDIEKSLMAPCCWSGTVDDHGHSKLEEEIAAFVDEGKSKQEIMDHYVDKYGERILAIPIAAGFNLFAWITPLFIGLAGIVIITLYLKASKSQPSTHIDDNKNILFSDQIEKELKELD